MPQLIGTRFESSLHRDLKIRYAGQDGQTEVEVAGFVADGITAQGEFIEVQTGSFAPLKQKARELTQLGTVRVVFPVIITKYVEVFTIDGNRAYRRKSSRKGSPWDLFFGLVYAPELPFVRNLCIELALLDVIEIRIQDGKGSWRRGGNSIADRVITAFHEQIILKKPSDYLRFIPFERSESFTSTMLGEKAGIRASTARKALYVLTKMNLIEKIGKQRNAVLYRIVSPKKPEKRKNTT